MQGNHGGQRSEPEPAGWGRGLCKGPGAAGDWSSGPQEVPGTGLQGRERVSPACPALGSRRGSWAQGLQPSRTPRPLWQPEKPDSERGRAPCQGGGGGAARPARPGSCQPRWCPCADAATPARLPPFFSPSRSRLSRASHPQPSARHGTAGPRGWRENSGRVPALAGRNWGPVTPAGIMATAKVDSQPHGSSDLYLSAVLWMEARALH